MASPYELAGPVPAALHASLAQVRKDLDNDRIDQAEAAILSLLETDASCVHLFLLLTEVSLRRSDLDAACDFLRNAAALVPANAALLQQAVDAMLSQGRLEDARELYMLAGLDDAVDDMAQQTRRDPTDSAIRQFLELFGVSERVRMARRVTDSNDAIVPAILGSTEASFDGADESPGQSSGSLPPQTDTSVIDHAAEQSGMENLALDASAQLAQESEASIIPARTPFAVTPQHQLAERTACPGLAKYILPLVPTWNVPRIEELQVRASEAIKRSIDFYESMHFRGMWPLTFNVAGVASPEEAHDERPRDFRWELASPGFARLQLAHLVPAYEATRNATALKHVLRSAKALAVHQHRLGGWATTYRVRRVTGRGTPASFPANAVWLGNDSTTTTLCLLVFASQQVEVGMVTTASERAVQAIVQSQNSDGSFPMAWVEQERARVEMDRQYGHACLLHNVPDNVMRALALARYTQASVHLVTPMLAYTNWLLDAQNKDGIGGWHASYDNTGSFGPQGPAISLSATCSAIDALCFGATIGKKAEVLEAVKRALRWVETFERVSQPIPDLFDMTTGEPMPGAEWVWPANCVEAQIYYLRRRVVEDLMGQQPVPEKILRGRILHDAMDMSMLVSSIVQCQHVSGMWADANLNSVPAGSFLWTLSQFLLQYQAGVGQIPIEGGRRLHWQDFLMPDRQWLRVDG